MGFHPSVRAVIGPMLKMADESLEASLELPSFTKRRMTNALPLVSGDTGLLAKREVCIRVGCWRCSRALHRIRTVLHARVFAE